MMIRPNSSLIFLLIPISFLSYGQGEAHKIAIGLNYGFGNRINNKNYTYNNNYTKLDFYYSLKKGRKFDYQLMIEPQLNFAKHQLLNLYFVTPDEVNYQEKRDRFTKLKDIKEYILGIGFLVRKPITSTFSIYTLVSIGPMITDTETERLSKGFAFADVFSVGIFKKIKRFGFDLRTSLRHTSNAGLQNLNSGINTLNFETGLSYQLN
jgi:hypothetical protein